MTRTLVAEVAFSISGAFIAEQARGFVIADKWRVGLDMLVEDLGMPYEMAFQVLRGEKTLVGDSSTDDIMLTDVKEGDQEVGAYLGNLQYKYAGPWEHQGKVYVPYARVDSYDEHDIRWAAEEYSMTWNARRTTDVPFTVMLGRVMYYSENRENELATICGRFSRYIHCENKDPTFMTPSVEGGYLWKLAVDLPLWIKPHKTADAALSEFMERRGRFIRKIDCATVTPLRWQLQSAEAPEVPFTSISDNLMKTAEDLDREIDEIALEVEEAVEAVPPSPAETEQEAKKRRYEERLAREEKAEQERQAKRELALQRIREEIIEDNGNEPENWIRIPVFADDEERDMTKVKEWLSVPRKPFLRWVYNRSPAWRIAPHLLPEWTVKCPTGMKMYGDDPVHSDWVVGAGLDPEAFYQHDGYNAATYRKRWEILNETLGFEIEVFSGSGYVSGKVKMLEPGDVLTNSKQIGVIANGSMEYDAALRSAVKHNTAIIMAVGGKVCHAAVVARETGLRLVMWPNAMTLKDGDDLWLDLDKHSFSVHCT